MEQPLIPMLMHLLMLLLKSRKDWRLLKNLEQKTLVGTCVFKVCIWARVTYTLGAYPLGGSGRFAIGARGEGLMVGDGV